ncbi:MAG: dihydrolipoamide acetyltransferase family protein [Chloroflexota bacterium]
MATEIIMPKVDMVMETGTFVEWLKQEGEPVRKGDALFVIMSDKSAIELDSPASGMLAGLSAKKDDVIPVAQTIGYILAPGEQLPSQGKPAAPSAVVSAAPPKETPSAAVVIAPPAVQMPSDAGAVIRATPLARKMAKQMGIDLSVVAGRGERGRIYKADILAFEQKTSAVVSPQPVMMDIPLPDARIRQHIALKGVRAIIAKRMAYSASTIPHIYESVTVNMSEAIRMRARISPAYEEKFGHKPSYTAILTHAVAKTLMLHPNMNSSLAGEEVIQWEDIHIGIATSLEDYLIVPVVREVQKRNLESIVEEMDRLLNAARTKRLEPRELSGSTFTISNLGMHKIESFTAIINPPEAAILAVGAMEDAAVVVRGKQKGADAGDEGESGTPQLVIQPVMKITIAADHRINDGVAAAKFLTDLKAVLENPYLLI